MTVIKIGHSAYRGTNALRFCFSKAQAVRVLRNRGMTRNAARLTIKNLTARQTTALININYSICEIADMTGIFSDPAISRQHGHYNTPQQLQAAWKNAPEL